MYDAFISYSHAVDGKLAPALQTALEKFAKPWYKARNLNIFRDESSLAVTPHLWPNIQKALDSSSYLIVMASPASAASKWVRKEIEYWLENKSADTLLIALTEGQITWDDSRGEFFGGGSESLPRVLNSYFREEPFYIDLTGIKEKGDLSLNNPGFKKQVIKLSAQLHGKEPKEMESEALSEYRKMLRIRNAAIGMLSVLLVAVILAAVLANSNRKKAAQQQGIAKQQTLHANANHLLSEAGNIEGQDPTIALRLAEQASLIKDDSIAESALLKINCNNIFYKTIANTGKPISGFHLLPGGRNILVGFTDTVVQYDVNNNMGQPFIAHPGSPPYDGDKAIAYSQDGNSLFIGSDDNQGRIYNVHNHSYIEIINADMKMPGTRAAAFSHDGTKILIQYEDGHAGLFDIAGKPLHRFDKFDNVVVAFAPDGSAILTGDDYGKTILWDLEGNILHKFIGHKEAILSLAFSADGKWVLTGSYDNTAKLWNINGSMLHTFTGHAQPVSAVAFSPDNKTIMTGSQDRTARLWDLQGNLLQELKGHTGVINAVEFNPDDNTVLTGSVDGSIRSWKLKQAFGYVFKFPNYKSGISRVALSPDGKSMAFTYDNLETIFSCQIHGNSLHKLQGLTGTIRALAFSPDGTSILGRSDNEVKLWDTLGNLVHDFGIHKELSVALFSPGEKTILLASGDKLEMYRYDGTLLKSVEIKPGNGAESISLYSFSGNGQQLLLYSADDTIFMYDVNGKLIMRSSCGDSSSQYEITCVALSPDGQTFLTGSDDDITRLWDLDGHLLKEFKTNQKADDDARIKIIEYLPDGKSFLTGSSGETVCYWDIKGNLLQEIRQYNDTSNLQQEAVIAFSIKSRTIFTCSEKGVVHLNSFALPPSQFLKADWIERLSNDQKRKFGID